MKLLNILLEEGASDCDRYFDLDGIYKDHVEFYMPLYSILNKSKTARLLYMSPKKYIYTVARGFGGLSYQDAISPTNSSTIDKYVEAMRSGDKFPVIYYRKNSSDQEGRHRALAAEKLGCEEIPVIEFINLTSEQVRMYAITLKGDSYDEVNNYFIELGFKNGITEKGYNDLQRYIEFRL